jgi:hypothetical protein
MGDAVPPAPSTTLFPFVEIPAPRPLDPALTPKKQAKFLLALYNGRVSIYADKRVMLYGRHLLPKQVVTLLSRAGDFFTGKVNGGRPRSQTEEGQAVEIIPAWWVDWSVKNWG